MSLSKLVMRFGTSSGDTTTLSYNYIKPDIDAEHVGVLMAGIITNGSIFANVPVIEKSAKLVTTTESEYELDI